RPRGCNPRRHPSPLRRKRALGLADRRRLLDELRGRAEARRGAGASPPRDEGAPRARASRPHRRGRGRSGARHSRRARDDLAWTRRSDVELDWTSTMSIVSVDKDYDNLTITLIAE